jgi:hypothetical protein
MPNLHRPRYATWRTDSTSGSATGVHTVPLFGSPHSFVSLKTVLPREVSTPMQFFSRTLTIGTWPTVSQITLRRSPATTLASSIPCTHNRCRVRVCMYISVSDIYIYIYIYIYVCIYMHTHAPCSCLYACKHEIYITCTRLFMYTIIPVIGQ